MSRATRVSILITIALAAVIAVLTLMPPNQVEVPSGSDKTYHFLAFAALALPLAAVRPRWSVALFLLYSAFGGAIEIIQPFVGRSRELADLVADMAGIAIGMALGFLAHLLFQRLGGWGASTGDESRAGTSSSTRHRG
ncbi:MAG: VanZ family protein [Arachnia sp.]